MSVLEIIEEFSAEMLKQNVEVLSIKISQNGYDQLVDEIQGKKKLTIAAPNGRIEIEHD